MPRDVPPTSPTRSTDSSRHQSSADDHDHAAAAAGAACGQSARHDLETAIQRIHTLAELHSRLYRDEGFDGIEMAGYLGEICDGLRGAAQPPRIDLQCLATPLKLTLDQAVPRGQIASELVTNAAKCAFPGDRAGKVVVRLNPEGNDAILSVADDGIGVPATVEPVGTGLGLTMVRGLAQQVCGILAMENDGGTRLTLRFKPAAAFVAAMRNSSLGVRRYCPHNRDQEGQA